MVLHDVSLYGKPGRFDILCRDSTIQEVVKKSDTGLNDEYLALDGGVALPGFINSHDHLDFNVFPQVGHKTYSNYRDWGPEIQSENKELIDLVLKIPLQTRIQWGIYKNLLNGFTTVFNHGHPVAIDQSPIDVIQDHYSLHSVAFEKNWKLKLNHPLNSGKFFVMHLGEGSDHNATKEIDEVIKWNLFKRKIIAVHGVGMNNEQARHFKGLVWCPASNFFMLNKTAAIDSLKNKTTVVFGTDSTLTSSWNTWAHLRMALETNFILEDELFEMVTAKAAGLWDLNDRGKIEAGKKADIVVLRNTENVFDNNPEDLLLVVKDGKVRVIDKTVNSSNTKLPGFSEVQIENTLKYVEGDLKKLIYEIKSVFGEAVIPFEILPQSR